MVPSNAVDIAGKLLAQRLDLFGVAFLSPGEEPEVAGRSDRVLEGKGLLHDLSGGG